MLDNRKSIHSPEVSLHMRVCGGRALWSWGRLVWVWTAKFDMATQPFLKRDTTCSAVIKRVKIFSNELMVKDRQRWFGPD